MIFYSGLNLISLKIRTIYFTSPPTYKKAKSSASVVDLITAFYLVACHIISPLNKLIKKPCELQHVKALSAKLASETVFKTWFILYSMIVKYLRAKNLVL